MGANLRPLLEQLSILNKQKIVVPFRLNPAQEHFLSLVHDDLDNRRPLRYIVLKARQMGLSTFIESLIFTFAFGWPNTAAQIIAHEKDAGRNLLAMTDRYWRTYPFRALYTTKFNSRNELYWRETESFINVSTAANKGGSRSATLTCIHASEVAFWNDAETVMLGLMQTLPHIPRSFLALESTANGVGNYFYNQWKAAEAGDVDLRPMFFPWYNDPTYRASYINLPVRPMRYDSDERALMAIGVDEDQLAWRRWAIKNKADNDINKFHQEYPATPDEAFISTGTNVFPVSKLAACYKKEDGTRGRLVRDGRRVRFTADMDGPLTIYRYPADSRDYGVYLVAGDPTHSTRGDYACIQVINRRTYEQVAVWRGRIDPASFAGPLQDLGRYYNDALVTTEIEGPGYATVGALLESGYPYVWKKRGADRLPGKVNDNYGWSTTYKTKEWAIGFLLKLVMDKDIQIHDQRTFYEMRDYVTLPGGGYGPADTVNGYDDTVMALAIACICSQTEGPLPMYDEGPSYMMDADTNDNVSAAAPWEMWGEDEAV